MPTRPRRNHERAARRASRRFLKGPCGRDGAIVSARGGGRARRPGCSRWRSSRGAARASAAGFRRPAIAGGRPAGSRGHPAAAARRRIAARHDRPRRGDDGAVGRDRDGRRLVRRAHPLSRTIDFRLAGRGAAGHPRFHYELRLDLDERGFRAVRRRPARRHFRLLSADLSPGRGGAARHGSGASRKPRARSDRAAGRASIGSCCRSCVRRSTAACCSSR